MAREEPTGVPLPMPAVTAELATDVEIEYFRPVYVGNHLSLRGQKLVAATLKQTAVGYGAFMTFETAIYNQRGELVATERMGFFRYDPTPPASRSSQGGRKPA